MTKPPKIAVRSQIQPFRVMDVMSAAAERERAGGEVVHMEVGEPGHPTPRRAVDAAERAMRRGDTGYTLALGMQPLRERIARLYLEEYGVEVNDDRVVVTTGSSSACTLAFLACFDIGDRVAIGRPGYPAYGRIMQALGIEPVEISTRFADKFQPTPAQIADQSGLDGVMLASPANPTGTMIAEQDLEAICRHCADQGIRVISDEIYHRVTYAEPGQTALKFNADAIAINSFSKYYCMTGWRIGWMVVPEALIRPVERLAQNFFISPPTPAQHAALAVLDCADELDTRIAGYAKNRELLLGALARLGLEHTASADGAFYLYVDVSSLTNDSEAFCKAMLDGAGVAGVPGVDFDAQEGNRYMRLCYAIAEEEVCRAIERLEAWLPTQR